MLIILKNQTPVELKNIYKTYTSENAYSGQNFITEALSNINISFYPAEIHTLLGENGAGKSTLVNILSGLLMPSSGTVKINEREQVFKSPGEAIKAGIGIVHQEPVLAYNATVLENVMIGLPKQNVFPLCINSFKILNPLVRIKEVKQKLELLKENWQVNLHLNEKIKNLPPAERFYTALFSVLCRNPQFLILDEPASVFTEKTRAAFFKMLRQTAASDCLGIILITHKFKDAISYTDKISILKKGRIKETFLTKSLNEEKNSEEFLKDRIFGKETAVNDTAKHYSCNESRENGFEFNIELNFNTVKTKVKIAAKKGCITGVAAFADSGIDQIEDLLSGMAFFSSANLKHESGFISVNTGNSFLNLACKKINPAILLKNKIGFIPSDRIFRASNPTLSIEECLNCYRFKKNIFNKQESDMFIQKILTDENINAEKTRLASNLSGGQLQRLILARCLAENPEIIIASEPMHGLDVLSTEILAKKLRLFTQGGKTLIVLTKEFDTMAYKNFFDDVYFLGKEN